MKKDIHLKKFSVVARSKDKINLIKNKVIDELCKHSFVYDEEHPELIISIGGDGTLLYAVHQYLDRLNECYFVAIHAGNLGFFTDYREDQVDECIKDIIRGEVYEVHRSNLLYAKVNQQDIYALNEIRIENIMRTQMFDIYVDQEFFETFKGNGVCVSTQAGSSAYNRSLKGAIIDDSLSLIQLTEIAGIHDSKHRSLGVPYILRSEREITFKSDNFMNAYVCYDHKYTAIEGNQDIVCTMSNKYVQFIRYRKYSYLERVRTLY